MADPIDLIDEFSLRLSGLYLRYGELGDVLRLSRFVRAPLEYIKDLEEKRKELKDEIPKVFRDVEKSFSDGVSSKVVEGFVLRLASEIYEKERVANRLKKSEEEIDELLKDRKVTTHRRKKTLREFDEVRIELEKAGKRLREIKQHRVKGASVAQRENRQLKRDAFVWLDTNAANYKNMSEAATALEKVVPVKWRTAYDWAREWRKPRS